MNAGFKASNCTIVLIVPTYIDTRKPILFEGKKINTSQIKFVLCTYG